MAIIDWYSRRVLSWRISNSMEAVFCVDCLEEALRIYGKPEVFNSDQGCQFTSDNFTGVLKREGITIQAWTGGAARLTYACSRGILSPAVTGVSIVSTKETGGHYGDEESCAAQAQR